MKLQWGKLENGTMSRTIELPVAIDQKMYTSVKDVMKENDETDIQEIVVKLLQRYVIDGGCVNRD